MKKRFAFTMTEPAESVLQLNPCESLTNILNPSGRTTKSLFCHSELVSESVPSYGQLSNIGQTLKRVQGDKFLSLRAVVDRVAIHSTLVLRLALNATARACSRKRGFACRALDSTQGKPCSVALLGLAFTMALPETLMSEHGTPREKHYMPGLVRRLL